MKKPTFIYDYPAERGALARLKRDDPTVAERFELYISGLELANAFSELVTRKSSEKDSPSKRPIGALRAKRLSSP